MAAKPPTSYGDLKTQPQRTAYGLGYRSGMEDLALKIRDEGLAGAIQWIKDNGNDAAREALASVDTSSEGLVISADEIPLIVTPEDVARAVASARPVGDVR